MSSRHATRPRLVALAGITAVAVLGGCHSGQGYPDKQDQGQRCTTAPGATPNPALPCVYPTTASPSPTP